MGHLESGRRYCLATTEPQLIFIAMSTSIRNHLPGTIEQIVSDKVVSEIVINTAAGPVTSIITTGSVKRMNLQKGDAVFAIIKATEVSVEKES